MIVDMCHQSSSYFPNPSGTRAGFHLHDVFSRALSSKRQCLECRHAAALDMHAAHMNQRNMELIETFKAPYTSA